VIDQQFHQRIQEVVDLQGWDDNTVLGIALRYINENNQEGFVEYMQQIADDENSEADVMRAEAAGS
jgi:hypothetical protein